MKHEKINDKSIIIFCSIMIVIVCTFNLLRLYGPIIVPDETGYWAAGYFFNGNSWNSIMGTSGYYGWGYGVVLSLICKVTNEPVIAFRIAIIVNALLLMGGFILALKVSRYIFNDINEKIRILICFTITVYSSYLYNTQTTYCETLILFMYWAVILLIMKIIEKPRYRYLFFLSLALAALVSIHLRTLVIIVAVLVEMAYLLMQKKINLKKLVVFFSVLIVMLVGVMLVKQFLEGNLYKNSNIISTNTVSGQVDKLSRILSWNGILELLKSIVGKLMYAGTATFLLAYVGIIVAFCNLIKGLFQCKEDISIFNVGFCIFVIIAFGGALLISALSLITYGRIDHIIYGRYNEYLFGSLILYALGNFEIERKKRVFYAVIFFHILMNTIVFNYVSGIDGLTKPSVYSIAGVWGIGGQSEFDPELSLTLYSGILALVVFAVVFALYTKWKKSVYLLLVILWGLIAIVSANESLYSEQELREIDYCEFAENVADIVSNEPVYYVINDTEYVSWLKFKLKFFMPDTEMIACESDEYNNVEAGDYVIVYNMDTYKREIVTTLGEALYSSKYFSLYRKEGYD